MAQWIDGEALERRGMLEALEAKYRHLVENGSPEYDLQTVGVE